MKNTSDLSTEQKKLLIGLVKQRVVLDEWWDIPNKKSYRAATSVTTKLSSNLPEKLTSWEKTICISVLNEQAQGVRESIRLNNLEEYINATAYTRELCEQLDSLKDILELMGEGKGKTISGWNYRRRYWHVFKALDRLKNSKQVFYSKTTSGEFYKIGFLSETNILTTLRLSNTIESDDIIDSQELRQPPAVYAKSYFSALTSKEGALLAFNSRTNELRENNVALLNYLLN